MTPDELRSVLDEYFGLTYVWRGFVAGVCCVCFPAFWGWVRSVLRDVDSDN